MISARHTTNRQSFKKVTCPLKVTQALKNNDVPDENNNGIFLITKQVGVLGRIFRILKLV